MSLIIGVLLLKHGVNTQMSANSESRDAARLTQGFSEDVVVTFPGKEPVVGREATDRIHREILDKIADEHIAVQGVALARPCAFSLCNTALCDLTRVT